MTPQDIANTINGRQYRDEIPKDLLPIIKNGDFVVVYGASDDLMEFDGAIHDEIGCYNGGIAYLTKDGLLVNECDSERCPFFAKMKKEATTITALWDNGGFSWRYETAIPHAKFIIKEDDDNYCEGIVFALSDVP